MSKRIDEAGRFLSRRETQMMKDTHSVHRNPKVKKEDYVLSEVFGAKQVMHLLSQPGCVGLRIHHAKRREDEDGKPTEGRNGPLKARVLLTGVDAQGRDMPVRNVSVQSDNAGLKDMPPGDDDGGGQSLGDGFTCPRHCP